MVILTKDKYSLGSREKFVEAFNASKDWQKCDAIANRGYIEKDNVLYFYLKGKERTKINYEGYCIMSHLTKQS